MSVINWTRGQKTLSGKSIVGSIGNYFIKNYSLLYIFLKTVTGLYKHPELKYNFSCLL